MSSSDAEPNRSTQIPVDRRSDLTRGAGWGSVQSVPNRADRPVMQQKENLK